MEESKLLKGLLQFLKQSPTPFHAVENMVAQLKYSGFSELKERDDWALLPGQNYYVIRNNSSIIAFKLGSSDVLEAGIRMAGAHTDSPCLKVKPQPEIVASDYLQLGVEVYGGALLNPWFDRDLSIAGRVSYATKYRKLESALLDFQTPIAVIPSLAIHLDRDVNSSRSINPQKNLPPILLQQSSLKNQNKRDETNNKDQDYSQLFRNLLKKQLLKQYPDLNIAEVLDFDLSLYDTQAPALVGLQQEFISSARLDNLISCYLGLASLISCKPVAMSLLVCNDHEEVGSLSSCGARGPFLKSVIERIAGSSQRSTRVIDQSFLISVDNAHAVHPNYSDKHDEKHGPIINKGPVIKSNANQSYASNSETAAQFRYLCKLEEVPVQSYVVRSDMACGSTIGPLTAAELGVRTLDVGVPQLAMHSVRELSGTKDAFYLYKVLSKYFSE